MVIADDHPIVLDGLTHLLTAESDIELVQRCTNGDDALTALRREKPDVIVLDIRMPGISGLDVLRSLAQEKSATRAVLLTAQINDAELLDAARLGVAGIVLKESAADVLLQCIRAVAAGGRWLDDSAIEAARQRKVQRESAAERAQRLLTRRELDIARMVARGARNKEIAAKLGISEGTVKMHLHSTYEKLGLSGRLELSIFARDHALV